MVHLDMSDARRQAIAAWLTDQGIDPRTVPVDAVLDFVPTDDGLSCLLTYDGYVLESGRIRCDPHTGEPIRERQIHAFQGAVPDFPA
ncbi:hypothetical protein AB0469_31750 [Streptomyces sp. NPDC093801]|uniref:hypothetical protein n=1 Tax=Streptomyces sp. NPDC093801 TaxID=3155203 RepID=UPI00344E5F1A